MMCSKTLITEDSRNLSPAINNNTTPILTTARTRLHRRDVVIGIRSNNLIPLTRIPHHTRPRRETTRPTLLFNNLCWLLPTNVYKRQRLFTLWAYNNAVVCLWHK
jgi:hypothetical protein